MAKVTMPSKRQTARKPPKHDLNKVVERFDEVEETNAIEVVKEHEPVLFRVSNCKVLNVRNAPTKDSKIVAVIQNGTIVRIDELSTDTSWLHITSFGDLSTISPNSKSGYILAEYTSEV